MVTMSAKTMATAPGSSRRRALIEHPPAIDVTSSMRAVAERVTLPPFGTDMSGKFRLKVGKVAVRVTVPPISPGDAAPVVPSALV